MKQRTRTIAILLITALALALPALAAAKSPNSRGDFVGSERCATCHEDVYNEWKDTRHATVMRKLYTEDNHGIDAPWGTEKEPRVFTAKGHKYTSFMKGEEYWVTINDPKNPSRDITKRIDAVGYRTQTLFFSYNEEQDSLLTLPFAYWRGDKKGEHWTSVVEVLWYAKDGSLLPEEKLKIFNKFLGYENRCVECHLTGFEAESWVELPVIGRTVDKSNIWTTTEFATGCEKCHGPGGKHVKSQSKKDIVNPENLTGNNKGSECSQCHQAGHPVNYDNGFFSELPYKFDEKDPLIGTHFNVGDNLSDYYTFVARNKWPGTNYFKQSKSYTMGLAQSKHGENGMTCKSCHDPHKMQPREQGDALCLSCHDDKGGAEHQMSIHRTMDVQCVDCHMTWSKRSVDRSVRYDIRAHHFEVITPAKSLEQYDYIYQFTLPDADPEHKLTKSWAEVNELGNCYDSWKYPPNLKSCTDFDVMPNACSSCHHSEFPLPGKFDDEQRERLIEGQGRYERFLKATTK